MYVLYIHIYVYVCICKYIPQLKKKVTCATDKVEKGQPKESAWGTQHFFLKERGRAVTRKARRCR
jgi:hypothetical protein